MDIESFLNKDYFCNKKFSLPLPSDYAVVLGTSPDRLMARAEIAAHYYHLGYTKKLVLSGGAAYPEMGNQKECEILQGMLLSLGVPREAMILESSSQDTIQNILSSLLIIDQDRLLFEVKSITIITEPFHMARSLQLAKMLCPKFLAIHGYTEKMEEQWEGERALFEKEKAMLLWAYQTLGKDIDIAL